MILHALRLASFPGERTAKVIVELFDDILQPEKPHLAGFTKWVELCFHTDNHYDIVVPL